MSDDLNRRGKAYSTLGYVLRLVEKDGEAIRAFERAIYYYEQKGNLVALEQARALSAAPLTA